MGKLVENNNAWSASERLGLRGLLSRPLHSLTAGLSLHVFRTYYNTGFVFFLEACLDEWVDGWMVLLVLECWARIYALNESSSLSSTLRREGHMF